MPCDRRAIASGGRLPAASAAARRGTKPADEVLHPGPRTSTVEFPPIGNGGMVG